MKTIEYSSMEKEKVKWIPGEWNDEPDKIQYLDKDTGLPSLIVRNGSGVLCGYVGISDKHPLFQKDHDDVDIDIHGGLTFSGKCQELRDECSSVCHKVETGENDNIWWFGFNCEHCDDMIPSAETKRRSIWPKMLGKPYISTDKYRNISYVKKEIQGLARQLTDIALMPKK